MSRDGEQIILSASNFLRLALKQSGKSFGCSGLSGPGKWAQLAFYAGDNELSDVKLIVK